MPLDAGIYNALGTRPKSVMDYQQEYNALDQQSNTLAQGRLGLQQAQALMQQRNALRDAVQGGQIDLSNPAHQGNALAIAPDVAPGLLKTLQESATSRAVAAKDTAQADKSQYDLRVEKANRALSDISALTSPEEAVASLDQHLSNGDIDPQKYAAVKATIPQNAAQFPEWRKSMLLNILDAKTRLEMGAPKPTEVRLGDRVQMVDTNPNSPTFGKPVVAPMPVGNSPDAVLQAKTSTANNAATNATSRANNQANIQKDYTIAGIDANGQPVEGGGLLSPQAIINAATRYQIDGTLPPNLGRGAQGPRQTSQILNEAARQAAERGDSPEAQRITQLANKSSAAALTKLETQQTMVGAFEKNFAKNADIAQELSNKVDRTGVPLVNKWVNAGKRSISGDPDISAFDASVKATVNEYGKIVGGGTGSSATAQGEIAKIEGLLNAAQTKDQVKSVLDLMRRETANRMTAFEDQKTELKSGMIRPKAGAAPASAAGAHPADIQSLLDKYGK